MGNRGIKIEEEVPERYPLQQGLKLIAIVQMDGTGFSSGAISTTTRIETRKYAVLSETTYLVPERYPLQQGLKPSSFFGIKVKPKRSGAISTTTRIETLLLRDLTRVGNHVPERYPLQQGLNKITRIKRLTGLKIFE